MIKSPLRYPGGKSRAIKFLKDHIPPCQELREPFFGGGSFTFYCVQQYPQANFAASELYYELYCLWSQLKVNPEALVAAVRTVKATYQVGRELYQELMARREDDLSDLQRAIDFFVLNRITFSGVADSGGYSEASFKARFTDSSIDRLEQAAQILAKIEIYHQDYSQLLRKPGQDVFIFLDPPYYSVTKSKLYGKKGNLHTSFNHDRLHQDLVNCPHQWLMTYDNSDHIRDLYQDFYLMPWKLQYGMNNYKQGQAPVGKELLIANFDLGQDLDNHSVDTQQLSLLSR